MTPGRLIAVVGASGVGKDSVMAGILAARPDMHRVRRTITRAPGLGGEDYDAVTPEAFANAAAARAFVLQWQAHGLSYGLPRDTLERVSNGQDCLANLSRAALAEAKQHFEHLLVLNITASRDTLSKRLAARGRETKDDIAQRLNRRPAVFPDHLTVIDIPNDGPLEDAVALALAALQPVRA